MPIRAICRTVFLESVPLFLGMREPALSTAIFEFRQRVQSAVAASRRIYEPAGIFAIWVLNKRSLDTLDSDARVRVDRKSPMLHTIW